eukprot:1696863-Rhodomonas_salina.2
MSGTDIAYAGEKAYRLLSSGSNPPPPSLRNQTHATARCVQSVPGNQSCTGLRIWYAMSRTHIGPACRATRVLCDVRYCYGVWHYAFAMQCPVQPAIRLRACYTMAGTDIAYQPTRLLCERVSAYARATRCPVLTHRMAVEEHLALYAALRGLSEPRSVNCAAKPNAFAGFAVHFVRRTHLFPPCALPVLIAG